MRAVRGNETRKRYKKKSKALCAMCKGHKTGWTCRWKSKALCDLKRFEREHKEYLGKQEHP